MNRNCEKQQQERKAVLAGSPRALFIIDSLTGGSPVIVLPNSLCCSGQDLCASSPHGLLEELGMVHARRETVTFHVTLQHVAKDHACPTQHVPEEGV